MCFPPNVNIVQYHYTKNPRAVKHGDLIFFDMIAKEHSADFARYCSFISPSTSRSTISPRLSATRPSSEKLLSMRATASRAELMC